MELFGTMCGPCGQGFCFCNNIVNVGGAYDNINFLPDGIGSSGSGSSKVDPLGVRYHVRITLKTEADALTIAKAYTNYWKLSEYLWGFELSKEGQPHLHGAVVMPDAYNSGTMSKFFGRYKDILDGTPGYHHEIERDSKKNQRYCAKDDKIILTNFTEGAIKDLQEQIKEIQIDMKLSPKEKVLNHIRGFVKSYEITGVDGIVTNNISINDIKFEIVRLYVNIWDKLPPPNVKQLVLYCIFKLDCCSDNDIAYYI